MKKATPVNQETPFFAHELFFSKTDKKGIIQSGNSIFVRVSQFPKEKLIGSPHNIVRHPDMPKTVFKLFWDTLQSGNSIGAYVKNMSQSGSYYWVFAVAWPIPEGYLSLRLKPTSPLLETVSDLYKTLLKKEKEVSVDAGLQLLSASLNQLGFKTYRDFMTAALTAELLSRDKTLKREQNSFDLDQSSHPALELSNLARQGYENLFHSLVHFNEVGNGIKKNAEMILNSFSELSLLSINMAVSAEKLGEKGQTLAEVSNGFKKAADQIHAGISEFQASMTEVLNSVNSSLYQMGGARLQAEIVRAFLAETLNSGHTSADNEFKENFTQLTTLSIDSTRIVDSVLFEAERKLSQFSKKTDDLLTAINGLEVIRVSAKIEIAKLVLDHDRSLKDHVNGMEKFIKSVSKPMNQTRTDAQTFIQEIRNSKDLIKKLQKTLSELASQKDLSAVPTPPHINQEISL